jgi:hypothetical protein
MTDLKFKTTITDVDVYGLNHNVKIDDNIDIDFGKASAIIDWEAMLEVRSWGIKGLSCVVNNVKVSIPWEIYYDEDMPLSQDNIDKIVNTMAGVKHPTRMMYEGVLEIDSDNEFNFVKFEIENNMIGAFYPEGCEINFDDMTIHIS